MNKVKAININLDSEALEALDGDQSTAAGTSLNEVLSVKVDGTTIQKSASGLTLSGGAISGGNAGAFVFTYDLIAESLSSVAIYPTNSLVSSIPMAKAGSLASLAVQLTAPLDGPAASALTVVPLINGAHPGNDLDLVFAGDSATELQFADVAIDTLAFAAGDTVSLALTTDAALDPANAVSLIATLTVSFS